MLFIYINPFEEALQTDWPRCCRCAGLTDKKGSGRDISCLLSPYLLLDAPLSAETHTHNSKNTHLCHHNCHHLHNIVMWPTLSPCLYWCLHRCRSGWDLGSKHLLGNETISCWRGGAATAAAAPMMQLGERALHFRTEGREKDITQVNSEVTTCKWFRLLQFFLQ